MIGRCIQRFAVILPMLAGFAAPVRAEGYATVFAYFQIGRDDDPSANLRIEQFQAQLDLLHGESFTVMPLHAIIAGFEPGNRLPDRAVGLTFDDANRSVAENALPLLRKAAMTATIFVDPARADAGGAYMNWNELRRAARDGFAIGAKIDPDIVEDDTDVKLLAAINEALVRIHDQIGVDPEFFAYADGIADKPMRGLVQSRGFKAAFALQSGPASDKSDRFELPRFPMTEAFGTLDRFRVAASSLPMEATDILPRDSTVSGPNPPQIGFTIVSDDVDMTQLACFTEDQGKTPLNVLGNRAELRPVAAFDQDDTTRVNCTAPAHGANAGRWHWQGFNFFVPGGR